MSRFILASCFLIDALFAGVTQNAKKSIFPTTDAARENTFVVNVFAPLIETGVVDQVSFGSYTCGVPSKFRFENTGFESHSPYAPQHDAGGLEVADVEGHYADKWDNLMAEGSGWRYDAIADNNMAFWVTDLGAFVGYNEDSVDRVYLAWSWAGEEYFSIIFHNRLARNDMNQFELISDAFTGREEYAELMVESEPRAFVDERLSNYKQVCQENAYDIFELGVRRAVSDVQANLDWYISLFTGSIVDVEAQVKSGTTTDANGNAVTWGHVIISQDDSFGVSFYQRDGARASFGEFAIKDFEDGLRAAHANVMVNPFCCVDRWYDLHYAIPLNDDVAAVRTLENIMQDGDQLYTVFEIEKEGGENVGKGMFWTMVEPNGQIVQLQGPDYDSADVSVEFVVQPSYWDGTWCPQENEDEFQEYAFGDMIAAITYANKGEAQEEEEEDQEGSFLSLAIGGPGGMQSGQVLLTIVIPLFIVTVLLSVYCLFCDKTFSRNKLTEASYTYNTFE